MTSVHGSSIISCSCLQLVVASDWPHRGLSPPFTQSCPAHLRHRCARLRSVPTPPPPPQGTFLLMEHWGHFYSWMTRWKENPRQPPFRWLSLNLKRYAYTPITRHGFTIAFTPDHANIPGLLFIPSIISIGAILRSHSRKGDLSR